MKDLRNAMDKIMKEFWVIGMEARNLGEHHSTSLALLRMHMSSHNIQLHIRYTCIAVFSPPNDCGRTND
jgi:hypothetical protein